ncbi:MAG: hypothetical protein MZU84_03815 [Sphingobacterium sp.]|nr:hypothetical protein [Sphingobacterium sp.]
MKKRVLGFDIGIASIGYALVEIDESFDKEFENSSKIITSGVRIFTQAENSKRRQISC